MKDVRKALLALLERGDASLREIRTALRGQEVSHQLVDYHLRELIKSGIVVPYLRGAGLGRGERYFTLRRRLNLRFAELVERIPESRQAEREFLSLWVSATQKLGVTGLQQAPAWYVAGIGEGDAEDVAAPYGRALSEVGDKLIFAIKIGLVDAKMLAGVIYALGASDGDDNLLLMELRKVEKKTGFDFGLPDRMPIYGQAY